MEDKNDGKMGWNLFPFVVFWALSFEIIKFQPLIYLNTFSVGYSDCNKWFVFTD